MSDVRESFLRAGEGEMTQILESTGVTGPINLSCGEAHGSCEDCGIMESHSDQR